MRILAAVVDDMVTHAKQAAPHECCGLLLARGGVVVEAVRARNVQASPTRYLVDPVDHFAAIRRARAEGMHVAAAYHSHPAAPARPSATDVAEAHDPELLYVIVSLEGSGEDVQAWRIIEGRAHPVPMERL